MSAADRLRELVADDPHGYDPATVAAEVALATLVLNRAGFRDQADTVGFELLRFGITPPHANTLRAIARDRAGLLRAVRDYLDDIERDG